MAGRCLLQRLAPWRNAVCAPSCGRPERSSSFSDIRSFLEQLRNREAPPPHPTVRIGSPDTPLRHKPTHHTCTTRTVNCHYLNATYREKERRADHASCPPSPPGPPRRQPNLCCGDVCLDVSWRWMLSQTGAVPCSRRPLVLTRDAPQES
jgi:hypothetical protein